MPVQVNNITSDGTHKLTINFFNFTYWVIYKGCKGKFNNMVQPMVQGSEILEHVKTCSYIHIFFLIRL